MEVVSVVLSGHLLDSFIRGLSVYLCKLFYFGSEGGEKLFVGDTADGGEIIIHADVVQLVEVAEHAYVREVRYPCEEHEAEVSVGALQNSIKGFQDVTISLQQRVVVKCL